MVTDFIMQHFSYEDTLQWFGFIIIWQSIAVERLAKYKGETFFALVPLWFITLGTLLAFSFVGYIVAIIMVFATIYAVVSTARKKIVKRRISAIKRKEENSIDDHLI